MYVDIFTSTTDLYNIVLTKRGFWVTGIGKKDVLGLGLEGFGLDSMSDRNP